MTDQLRYNQHKPQMSYLLSMGPEAVATLFGEGSVSESLYGEIITALCEYASNTGPACDLLFHLEREIPRNEAEAVTACFEKGAAKYARGNYLLGAPMSQYLDCATRHIHAHIMGEAVDKESGCYHLAHAFWNIAMCAQQPPERDDRLYLNNPNLKLQTEETK